MTTIFAASNGGHLAQLFELAPRMSGLGEKRLWVSFDTEQSRTLLDGEKKVFIPYIAERDVAGICRGLRCARQILSSPRSITAVVSTGSAIALSFLPYAALRGIETHYIESAARVGRPSLTGRLMENVPGVCLYRQYAHVAGGRWKYGGSVFDGFQGVRAARRAVRRVVVTVGSDKAFPRLVEVVAGMLPPETDVLWQTGDTPLDGLDVVVRPFVPAAELEQAVRDADAVIAHAGCGSALMALKAGKYPVLVPRDPTKREVIDVHQIEIARWLEERGLAVARTSDELTFADLEMAASYAVVQSSDPPLFQLSRNG